MFGRLLPFASGLWQHRQLLWQFTLRNVEIRHRGSHLGLVWSVLNPLLLLLLYVFVFGYIFNGSFGVLPNESRMDYALGIFLGLTILHFASEVMAVAPTIIIANPNFVKKVVFPLEILPASNVGAAFFHLLISLTLVLLGILFFGPGLDEGVLWLPVILLPLMLMLLGVCWFFSAIGVFFRDITQIMQFASLALLFSSAVFYPTHKIPADAWAFLRFNPLLLAIELARDATLWHRPLNFTHLAYLYVTGIGCCYFSHLAFRRMKPAFADVI